MAEQSESTNQSSYQTKQSSKGSGYGKKPWWFWAIVYLIIAAIVYGVVYFLFFNNPTSSGSLY